jgi:hypothetical protein
MAQEKYPSFTKSTNYQPDYDCKELEVSGYKLKVSCNKNNPECQQFINEEKNKGFDVKIIDLDPVVNQDNKNKIDIWVKENK